MSMNAPRCPLCQGTSVTPATQFRQQSSTLSVTSVFQGPGRSWASSGEEGFEVGRCRVCLDCGYVLLFLSQEELALLQKRIALLVPLLTP